MSEKLDFKWNDFQGNINNAVRSCREEIDFSDKYETLYKLFKDMLSALHYLYTKNVILFKILNS